MVKELCEKVVEVRRVSDKEMTLLLVFEEDVLRQICGYAPQSGRYLENKRFFYDWFTGELDIHSADDLIV